MKHGLVGLIGLTILTLPFAARSSAPPPAPDAALAEGQVISSASEVTIGGWRKLYTVDYPARSQAGRVTTETPQCCVNVFGKGNALLVVKTEAVTRDASGNPLTERVQRKLWVTRHPGEVMADCQIIWIDTALSLVDEKTDAVRSVVVEGGELVLFAWRGSGSHCAFGD